MIKKTLNKTVAMLIIYSVFLSGCSSYVAKDKNQIKKELLPVYSNDSVKEPEAPKTKTENNVLVGYKEWGYYTNVEVVNTVNNKEFLGCFLQGSGCADTRNYAYFQLEDFSLKLYDGKLLTISESPAYDKLPFPVQYKQNGTYSYTTAGNSMATVRKYQIRRLYEKLTKPTKNDFDTYAVELKKYEELKKKNEANQKYNNEATAYNNKKCYVKEFDVALTLGCIILLPLCLGTLLDGGFKAPQNIEPCLQD